MEDIFLLAVTSMLLLRVAAERGTSVISDTERDGRFGLVRHRSTLAALFSGEVGARLLFEGENLTLLPYLESWQEISSLAHFGLLTDVTRTK